MRVLYFRALPLEKITLDSLERHPEYLSEHSMQVKFNDANQNYGGDIFESIRKYGQLDPSFGRYKNRSRPDEIGGKWVVEPGQTRWMALYKLKRPTQRILVLVRDEDEQHFHLLSNDEHREIKTLEEAFSLFKDKNNLPNKGYFYLKRKRKEWFKV